MHAGGNNQWWIQGLERGVSCACAQYQPQPLLMHICIDAMKVAAAVLTACNCRETSLFANYTWSKGVSMETPLDLPLINSCND